jgi:3-deoxy-manno-octulosonate cytidylyltransferase (CMP-KDO synthetase)
MGSSRFPGKPLCSILGLPMIEHVYKRCALAKENAEVFVASCDEIIKETVEGFGGRCIMTPASIERPALRVAEACKRLNLEGNDIVVVVQGDEPLIDPTAISKGVAELTNHSEFFCTNLCARLTEDEWLDKDEVKVVSNLKGHAIYMSRSPIPSKTIDSSTPLLKQLGVFFFRYKDLLLFQSLKRTPLEMSEDIEMLRAIEHSHIVKMVEIESKCISVDNPKQRELVVELMKADPVWPKYARS